ncbi:hypothetical protein JOC75_003651 [Metabacillus crassostreae]|uniref:DUF2953 domain-containing protein n=1 Tax=Metabacillus crassostreae TaxID=929098 RepID=UPI001958DE79|nr:hypothetical protein [Metabacillus crassostreae]
MIRLYWIIGILLLLLLLFFLIIFTRLTIILDLIHVGDNDHIKIKIKAWFGLLRYTIKIPFVKIDDQANIIIKQEQKIGDEDTASKVSKGKEKITPEEEVKALHDIKEIVQHVVGLHKIVQRFLRKIKVKQFIWHSQIGIGDAAHTGLITGVAWSIKGVVIGIVGEYMKLKTTPIVTITPEFNQICSRTKLQCIFQFRIGQAMLAGIQFLKYWKGGRPDLKSKPFSFFAN